MDFFELMKDRVNNNETVEQTLSRHYQQQVENDLFRFESRFNRKFSFQPDEAFWTKVKNEISPDVDLKEPYSVVFKVFYTEISKEIIKENNTSRIQGAKELEYVLSSLTREQFDYFINKYYLCTSNATDPEIENIIAQRFAFHASAAGRKNNILKKFKRGESLDSVYTAILASIPAEFIKQIGSNEDIKPSSGYSYRRTKTTDTTFLPYAVIISLLMFGFLVFLIINTSSNPLR